MGHLVYIAGPLYTPGERSYLEILAQEIESIGVTTYLPHRDTGIVPATERNTVSFFKQDVQGINDAQILVAVLNGNDVDSGTAFEIGYAFAKGKTILGLYEDTRIADPRININPMIVNATHLFASRDKLIAELKSINSI